ncbi:pyridine nucleotide-disulfide oxidoreductase domain-containing protein 1 [Centruroides vittatus]|uniref:pyridine nucleotide-disulfide oxidoreductase domain-containing protein 1 n=1 Tax=Centruroides vittatus TaxID=120091 RepID=UPI00350F42DF
MEFTFVIVGGGIAGVSCAEQLCMLNPNESVALVSSSSLVKAASNVQQITQTLQSFDVEEKKGSFLEALYPNLKVVFLPATGLNAEKKELYLEENCIIKYEKLCICTGATPKIIAKDNPYVLGIRDTETVQIFQKKLQNARRIIVVGNGGIATELVYEIENCQIIWSIKDKSVGSTFFDPGVAEFFLPHLSEEKCPKRDNFIKHTKYISDSDQSTNFSNSPGSALGPDWSSNILMKGDSPKMHDVHIEYSCEVEDIYERNEFLSKNIQETELKLNLSNDKRDWPIFVKLTNGKVYGCDFIVSATGVIPNTKPFTSLSKINLANDGGILVDDQMRTNIPDLYAAGDVCTAGWNHASHWFQMRLWTQARQMGAYAARCLSSHYHNEETMLDFCFELFEHVTKFFGYKVVLLGLYNGQKLGNDYELLVRVTKGKEFVKVILRNGKMEGAILVGETDLEETFENLILNQIDLSQYGEDLLNPTIDIEDYFD